MIAAADPRKRAKDAAFHVLLLACLGAGVALLGLERTELTPATVLGFVLLVAGVVLVTAR